MRLLSISSLLGLLSLLILADMAIGVDEEHGSTTHTPQGDDHGPTTHAPHGEDHGHDSHGDDHGPTTHTPHDADDHGVHSTTPKPHDDHDDHAEAGLKRPPGAVDKLLDVVLVFVGSGKLKHFEFRMIKRIALHLAKSLDIEKDGNREGLVLERCDSLEHIRLLGNLRGLQYKVNGLQRPNELCQSGSAFKRIPVMFRSHGRMEAAKVVVVVSNGKAEDPKEFRKAAETLKMNGVDFHTVAVGPDADKDTLQKVSSFASNWEADTFKKVFQDTVKPLADDIIRQANMNY